MIACNQNAVMGKLIYDADKIEVWNTPKKNSTEGWIGVFNRDKNKETTFILDPKLLGLGNSNVQLKDIWNNKMHKMNDKIVIPTNGVVFLKY